jgi:hypothetical protein
MACPYAYFFTPSKALLPSAFFSGFLMFEMVEWGHLGAF